MDKETDRSTIREVRDITGRVMNIHIQNCSTWLSNLHSRQNGGDDCVNRRTRVRYF